MARNDQLAAVAPTEAAARIAADGIAREGGARPLPFSLGRYLASSRAPSKIVLCPAGSSLRGDLAFLREASRRLLWPPPDEVLAEALEGLLGSHPAGSPLPPGCRRPAVRERGAAAAIFFEGTVSSARARRAAASGARLWIAESPRRVRVDPGMMETLRRRKVVWLALKPVMAVAVLAPPALAASRARWKGLLPRGTPVWRRKN
jgi:hypothetical protein